jgi:hypothetical protein
MDIVSILQSQLEQGKSLRAAAAELNLSHERVRQLIVKYNLSEYASTMREQRRREARENRTLKIRSPLLEEFFEYAKKQGLTVEKGEGRMGVTVNGVPVQVHKTCVFSPRHCKHEGYYRVRTTKAGNHAVKDKKGKWLIVQVDKAHLTPVAYWRTDGSEPSESIKLFDLDDSTWLKKLAH